LVRRIQKKAPEAMVVITGCYAQLKPVEIASIPGVNLVLGAAEKFNISQHLKELNKNADPTRLMMASLLTQQYFQRAASLALTIEEEFQKAGRLSREAKQRDQKGIWVLQAVAMPAVLIETGFISNPEDEEYLNSETGQNEICEVITKSLIRYKFSLENQQKNNVK
jgi:N-acetylmuramoyl-L-alanine amidase